MKKIIFLMLLVVFLSCSSNDDDVRFLNTPSWIRGTWKKDLSDDVLVITRGDIVYNGYSFGKGSAKPPFTSYDKVQVITENSTNYIFDYYPVKDGVPLRFIFKKINEKKIESKGHLMGIYIKK